MHDNFITTALYASRLPILYNSIIRQLNPPLDIINRLIVGNLTRGVIPREKLLKFPDKDLYHALDNYNIVANDPFFE